ADFTEGGPTGALRTDTADNYMGKALSRQEKDGGCHFHERHRTNYTGICELLLVTIMGFTKEITDQFTRKWAPDGLCVLCLKRPAPMAFNPSEILRHANACTVWLFAYLLMFSHGDSAVQGQLQV
ncbi:hypothetical protein BS47DRAFT_1344682, partial [Hydnum rufescens UP504]